MIKPLITGATGFIGKQLCSILPAPNILTRNPECVPPELSNATCFHWDPEAGPPHPEAFEGCDAVFHLAGESVADGRWNEAKKARIRTSRILGTRNLVSTLMAQEHRPAVLVCASAVGYYGSRGDETLDEQSSAGSGYLADVCKAWEEEALVAKQSGMRVVLIRIGMVLGRQGGALARMVPLFKLCAGGTLGNGKQWMPWIHVDDLARLFVFATNNESVRGPINGVAPNPVRNREFTQELGRAVKRPAFFPAPAFGLRLGLGEFASVLLASQRVLPKAATSAGFEFRYNTIDSALAGSL